MKIGSSLQLRDTGWRMNMGGDCQRRYSRIGGPRIQRQYRRLRQSRLDNKLPRLSRLAVPERRSALDDLLGVGWRRVLGRV